MSDLSEALKRLQELDQKVNESLQKRKHTNRWIMIGGVFFFLFALGYMQVFHHYATDTLRPEILVPLLSGEVKKLIPQAMASIQTSVKEAAPQVAREARIQALQAIPEIRKSLEDEFVHATEPYIRALEKELDTLIQQGIYKNRDAMTAFVKNPKDPATREKYAKVVRATLRSYFDDPLVMTDLKSYADMLKRLDAKFKRLRDAGKLSPDEQCLRNVILGMRELAKRSP